MSIAPGAALPTQTFGAEPPARESVALAYRHQPGSFCLGVALRGVTEAAGLKLSEAEVMGLGAAMCLRYGADLKKRSFHLEVCHSGVDMALFGNLGILARQRRTTDREWAEARMLELLRSGRPVAVKVNPRWCEGVMRATPEALVPFLHIHWVVVSAYDAERDTVRYHDNTRFAAWELPRDDFRDARDSGASIQHGRNTWLELEAPRVLVPLEVAYLQAIRQMVVSSKYLHRGGGYKGVDAATRYARHLKSWRTTLTPDEIRGNALGMMSSITLGGALKGAGRRHYAGFLECAGKLLDSPALHAAAAPYRELAGTWTALNDQFAAMAADPTDARRWSRGSTYFALLDALAAG
ncbi:MAG TPA: DUF4872 domain-containing protein, partial [Longimicrobiaceae bacterium]|nr:DUF4872 domain-containing protein [Longimicrobiaceae bacterium]